MEIHRSTSSILRKLQSIWRKSKTKDKKPTENNSTPGPAEIQSQLERVFKIMDADSTPGPAEIQSQLERVFKIMDADGDGKISSAELAQLALSLGHGHEQSSDAASREAEGIVRELDADGDGFVDLDEFMQAVGEGLCWDDYEDLREAFLVFDEDRNGFISAEELRRVMVGLGLSECSLRECRGMIRRFDRNGDGMVDFEEFRSLMSNQSK